MFLFSEEVTQLHPTFHNEPLQKIANIIEPTTFLHKSTQFMFEIMMSSSTNARGLNYLIRHQLPFCQNQFVNIIHV